MTCDVTRTQATAPRCPAFQAPSVRARQETGRSCHADLKAVTLRESRHAPLQCSPIGGLGLEPDAESDYPKFGLL